MSFGYKLLGFGSGSGALPVVTGGTKTTNGSYTVRTFTSTANLVVAGGEVPMDILVVGGGGGGPDNSGNGDFQGGGGGGGGILYKTNHTVAEGTYSASIGAGDNDTTFVSVTATKGGLAGVAAGDGGDGANGGGGSGYAGTSGGSGTVPSSSGWTGYGGNDGGTGHNFGGNGSHSAGGGGGGNAAGTNASTDGSAAGGGGAGRQINIDGNNYYWSGGGGGAGYVSAAGAGGSGGGGGGCFAAETKIQTIGKAKYIEDVRIGDVVRSFDLNNSALRNAEVTNTFVHYNERILVINGFLKTTPNHPFYSNGIWVSAGELFVGAKILNVDGTEHIVKTLELLDETETVYNFEVEGTHNYFADNYLVHNKSSDAGGGSNGSGGTGGINNGNSGTGPQGGHAGANTGGGGGGGSWTGSQVLSGNGGSGIVVVSYLTSLAK